MKNNNHQQLYKYLLIGVLMMFAVSIMAQEGAEDKKIDKRPVRKTFNSALILENQSVMVPQKGTFEMDIIHRFGDRSSQDPASGFRNQHIIFDAYRPE